MAINLIIGLIVATLILDVIILYVVSKKLEGSYHRGFTKDIVRAETPQQKPGAHKIVYMTPEYEADQEQRMKAGQ